MSKLAISNSHVSSETNESLDIMHGSDNGCGVKLAELEYSALVLCVGCGRRFVPTGAQQYCSHECYSATLRQPIESRFWTKVHKGLGCWLWTASTVRGYGQINRNGKPAAAHRLSWELAYGPIPEGCEVLHKCDVPACVRPDHLFLGSQQDNLTDARAKGRLDETRPRTSAKLTPEDRLAIYQTKGYRGVGRDLARRYGVTKMCISVIRKGRFARGSTRERVRAEASLDRPLEGVSQAELAAVGDVR